jgi:hypothetical protein
MMSNVYPTKSYANQANWATKQGQQIERNTSTKDVSLQKGTRDSIKTTIHKRDAFRPASDMQTAGDKNVVLTLNQNQNMSAFKQNRPDAKNFDGQRASLPNGKQVMLQVNQNLGYNSYRQLK